MSYSGSGQIGVSHAEKKVYIAFFSFFSFFSYGDIPSAGSIMCLWFILYSRYGRVKMQIY